MGYFNSLQYAASNADWYSVIIPLLYALFVLLWFWQIVDCARRSFNSSLEKVLWVGAMIFVPTVTPIAYFIVIKRINPRGIMEKRKMDV